MLEVITGCVFSGKTELLMKRIQTYEEQGKNVILLKPMEDFSRPGMKMRGVSVDNTDEIWEYAQEYDVIAIDEAQFFGWDFPEIVNELANQEKIVIVSGLDLDFKGKPFGVIPELIAYADVATKKTAVCSVCGKIASRSQRLVNGKPAVSSDPVISVSEGITYEARCRKHHEIR